MRRKIGNEQCANLMPVEPDNGLVARSLDRLWEIRGQALSKY